MVIRRRPIQRNVNSFPVALSFLLKHSERGNSILLMFLLFFWLLVVLKSVYMTPSQKNGINILITEQPDQRSFNKNQSATRNDFIFISMGRRWIIIKVISSLEHGSECLAIIHEVAGFISGTSTILNVD